jgi:hypothetical protein
VRKVKRKREGKRERERAETTFCKQQQLKTKTS